MKKTLLIIGMLAAGIVLAPAAGTPPLYKKYCAACHGKDGKGKTRAGKKVGVKDFTDAKYQASFTDEQALKNIKEGMKNEKTGKWRMKPFAKKLSDDQIKELIKYIRSLKK